MPKKPEVTLRRPSDQMVAFVETEAPKVPAPLPATPHAKRGTGGGTRRKTSDVKRQTSSVKDVPLTRWRRTVSTRADGTPEKRFTIRMPEDLAARFARYCDEQAQSMSEVMTDLVRGKLAGKRK